MLKEHYNPRCEPPWTDKELQHKVQDALKHSTQPLGGMLNGGPQAQPRPRPEPKILSATELDKIEYPPIKWAIKDILSEGATILAGPPKVGKSFLTLGLTLAIACGGTALGSIPVEAGEVLYLALEDGFRRLQGRMRRIMEAHQMQAPENLRLAVDWPRYSEGCLDLLEEWIETHKGTRLIVIDTLAKVRDVRLTADAPYDTDYHAIGKLQKLGQECGIAILIIHHTRKAAAEDEIDTVSGTIGLTGGADSVLVLKRQRQARDGTLFITGRDVEERKLQVTWDPAHLLWTISKNQDDPEATLSPEQRAVLAVVRKVDGPITIIDISHKLAKEYESTAKLVQRMHRDGLLQKKGYGQYLIRVQLCPTVQLKKTT